MKLYDVQATEYNGEQEYSQTKLLTAANIEQAWQLARKYFDKWYEDGNTRHADFGNPNRFEFIGGCIVLKIDSIIETTIESWIEQQVQLHSIGKLPQRQIACKKCQSLIAACEYIRDSLNVGGEQSRQFVQEIAYLNKVIKESKQEN